VPTAGYRYWEARMSKAPYTALPALALRYPEPLLMLEAIEQAGRQVSVPLTVLPTAFNGYGAVEHPVLTTPSMCGLPGGSLREIDGRIRSMYKLRTMSRLVACNVALSYPLQPIGPDFLLMIDFVNYDERPHIFYISNGCEARRDILEGALSGPTFGAVYFDKPDDADKSRDFIAYDQQLLYLAPVHHA
jgi:hypothetical protein